MRIENKAVVITGAASGFGRAAVQKFAGEGAKIVAADINADGLNAVVAAVSGKGGAIIGVETDVTKAAAVQELIDASGSLELISRKQNQGMKFWRLI